MGPGVAKSARNLTIIANTGEQILLLNQGMLTAHHHYQCSYLLSMSVADYTGQIWLQGFNDVAELILGISAKALKELTVG